MTHEIHCLDCQAPHTAKRSDAKYCPSCSLLRVMLYVLKRYARPRRCRACSANFRPLHVKDLALCGRCEPAPAPRSQVKGDRTCHPTVDAKCACVLCSAERPMTKGVPVCRECIKSVDGHAKVLKMLRAGKRKRKRDNAPAPV